VALTLSVVVDPHAVGAPVDPSKLRPEALRVLAESRLNAYVFAADPTLYLPAVLRQCVQAIPAVDLARLCEGAPTVARAESFVFLSADGLPCYEPRMPLPERSDEPDLPLAERLLLLRGASLLVRVSTPGGEQVLWLRPERLWQWSRLDAGVDMQTQVSRWVLEPAAAARILRPDPPTLELAAQAQFGEGIYRLVPAAGVAADGVGFWGKLAMTPLTLALDCTLFLPINALFFWLNDAADREERRQRRRQGRTGHP
jgi:hypothetical protein